MDMTLSTILGGRPRPDTRPNFTAVGRWLTARHGDSGAEACVFVNIAGGSAARVLPWVTAVRSAGFAVFAKPKVAHDDDIDDDIDAHVRSAAARGDLASVVLASHDAAAFESLLIDLAADGVAVTVLGFLEFAGFAQRADEIEFVDLESVPGAFTTPLPRTNLASLPREGAWFAPLHPLPRATSASTDETDTDTDTDARDHARIAGALRSLAEGSDAGVMLANVGEHLSSHLPDLDLKALGFSKLLDAVEALADEAGIEVALDETGHHRVRLAT